MSAEHSLENGSHPMPQHPIPVAGRSPLSFRDAHWPGRSIVVGLLFLLGVRSLAFVDRQWLLQLFPSAILFFVSVLIPVIFLLVFPIVSRSPRQSSLDKPHVRTRWLVEFAIAIPVVIGIYFMLAVVNSVATRLAPETSLTPDAVKGMTQTPYSPFVMSWLVLSFTIGPIAEEIFFRGFLQNAFRARMPAIVAGLLQSLIFAVCHVYSPLQVGVVFLMGVVLTGVYEWRKTLAAPILVHIGINLISAAMVLTLMWLHANRPVMGVICDPGAAKCVIIEIAPNSAAEEAGLEVGDEIIAFNGQPIRNFENLLEWIRLYRAGDAIPVRILREEEEREITVVLRRREQ